MDKIKKDKQLATDVLLRFKKFDRYSNILGGFPRDLHFNKPYRDVDIYARGCYNFNTVDYYNLITLLLSDFKLDNYENTGSMNSDTLPNILNTSEFEIDGLKFNIIFTKKIQTVHDFDFDLCMFFYDHVEQVPIFLGPELDKLDRFRESKINPIISKEQVYYSLEKHLPKLKEKYPDFKFII